MAQSCLRIARCDKLGHRLQRRMMILRRFVRLLWKRLLACPPGKPRRYRMLPRSSASPPPPPEATPAVESDFTSGTQTTPFCCHCADGHRMSESDLVRLKITLLGDPNIGKTSFLAKYVGDEKGMEESGMKMMDKTLCVGGARISYSIWEVEGNEKSVDQIPRACKDTVAILIMFDLTSRCTLNSVISWYHQARKYNQTAIPVFVGTKFDEFIQLPIDLQWTIASQARAYAKAVNATLFFSSATYNINVNKIFKFITAKIFDLPWTVERNLTIGEPIIDF